MNCDNCHREITGERELIEYDDGTEETLCSRCYHERAEAYHHLMAHYSF